MGTLNRWAPLGGAALFEAGPRTFRMFDANDPEVAPRGTIVRSNFSTTAQRVPPAPDPESLTVSSSGERYARACRLIDRHDASGLTVEPPPCPAERAIERFAGENEFGFDSTLGGV